MRKFQIYFLACLLILIFWGCDTSKQQMKSNIKEASTEIDLENAQPLLNRVSSLIDSGFAEPEIELILQTFNDLKNDGENELTFQISYKNNSHDMRLLIHKEDVDIMGLYFYTHDKLSSEIQKEIILFFEEQGL